MATVILSAVGTIVGGPIGSAIGSVIGQQIDRAVLGSGKARQGPRIKELELQTSSYGTQIPAIFGAMRVAGTVIWSTDLIERRARSGGGKGRPSTVNYSYSASFAVALSSRPIGRIGRIWADGNVLRGAAGDFKSETLFRFYNGFGDQPHDPLLASAEAAGQMPAYRGLAYAVFEDFQLADFGNRIPSLTFEIFERDTPVPLAAIASSASKGAIMGDCQATLTGYAVQGADCRAALQPLLTTFPVIARPLGDRLALTDWNANAANHILLDAAISDGTDQLDRTVRSRGSNSQAPSSLSIRHYAPERDFLAGVQTSRQYGHSRNAVQIDLPAALDSDAARALADTNILQMWRGLNGLRASLPNGDNSVRAGDWLTILDDGVSMRVTDVEYQRGTTRVTAAEWAASAPNVAGADPGRSLPALDNAIGQTHLIVIDLPALSSDDPAKPVVAVAAAGTDPGWRRAALSIVDGNREIELGRTKGIATLGETVGPIQPHFALLQDSLNQPVIRLLHVMMTLPPGSGDPTGFDAPMLWVGGEIIRYGHAEKIGPTEYRISGLLRGCFGTKIPDVHTDKTDVLLLDADSMLVLNMVPISVGSELRLRALGLGDAAAVEEQIIADCNAIRPRTPVHGALSYTADGGLMIEWKRCERLVSLWADGTDVGNSEGSELYYVDLLIDNQPAAAWTVAIPQLFLTAAEMAALPINTGSNLRFSIAQQGRFARSAPLIVDGQISQ